MACWLFEQPLSQQILRKAAADTLPELALIALMLMFCKRENKVGSGMDWIYICLHLVCNSDIKLRANARKRKLGYTEIMSHIGGSCIQEPCRVTPNPTHSRCISKPAQLHFDHPGELFHRHRGLPPAESTSSSSHSPPRVNVVAPPQARRLDESWRE